MATGGCHCGAIRYETAGEPAHSALCHCSDCRRATGAPMVGWALFPETAVTISGEPAEYRSSADVIRRFCGTCGTSLFYTNPVIFPGMVDIQTATLDDQGQFPPAIHIQYAAAAPWMDACLGLPKFAHYPE